MLPTTNRKVKANLRAAQLSAAAEMLNRFPSQHPDDHWLATSMQAVLFAASGRELQAEEKINEAIARGKGYGHFHHTAYQIASTYTLMHKNTEAIRWPDEAAKTGFPCYSLFETDKDFDGLRGDPRFIALMADLKKTVGDPQNAL